MQDLIEKLKNVDLEKLNRIINSAMKEFGENGFEKASTNKIVKDANVSKGLLFHYFGTKENLYNYLKYFAIESMSEQIFQEIDFEDGDILERIKKTIYIKMGIAAKYPYISDFSVQVFKDSSLEEILEFVPNFNMEDYISFYTKNIDYSLFKDNIDIEKAVNIVRWTMDGLSEDIKKKIKTKDDINFDKISKEFYEYLDFFKIHFYKEENYD
ncbi:MAG: TetR/AcrR family transcriptional regulator [Tissierellia bacterium]|nr:TetR/AcrR family transcriptional regulator [Tissierellia bacterium]